MANEVTRPQGGQKDDATYPDGIGKPSENDPVLPSPQPIKVPASFTRKK